MAFRVPTLLLIGYHPFGPTPSLPGLISSLLMKFPLPHQLAMASGNSAPPALSPKMSGCCWVLLLGVVVVGWYDRAKKAPILMYQKLGR